MTTTKKNTPKKAVPKRRAKKKNDGYITVNTYGTSAMTGSNLIGNAYNGLINTMLGERIPDSLEGQVEFWKKKYEDEQNRSAKYKSQVSLLEIIIGNAIARNSSNG